jgi:hypothetical protein
MHWYLFFFYAVLGGYESVRSCGVIQVAVEFGLCEVLTGECGSNG